MKRLIILGMVWCLPGLAGADERGTFVELDREGTTSAIGLDVSMLFPRNLDSVDLGLRENLWGRYVSPLGLGGYGQIALSHVFGDGDSEVGLADIELGALYMLAAGDVDITFRLGLGLPNAPDDESALATVLNGFDRVHDFVLILPHSLWIRPGVGVRLGSREFFAQADVGVDIPIKTDDPHVTDVFLHLNAGIGTRQGPVQITLELASLGSNFIGEQVFDDGGFGFLHNLGVSLRYVDGPVQPFIAYVLPFKFGEEIPGHVVTAGLQGVF